MPVALSFNADITKILQLGSSLTSPLIQPMPSKFGMVKSMVTTSGLISLNRLMDGVLAVNR